MYLCTAARVWAVDDRGLCHGHESTASFDPSQVLRPVHFPRVGLHLQPPFPALGNTIDRLANRKRPVQTVHTPHGKKNMMSWTKRAPRAQHRASCTAYSRVHAKEVGGQRTGPKHNNFPILLGLNISSSSTVRPAAAFCSIPWYDHSINTLLPSSELGDSVKASSPVRFRFVIFQTNHVCRQTVSIRRTRSHSVNPIYPAARA